jgi:hypothetical protein
MMPGAKSMMALLSSEGDIRSSEGDVRGWPTMLW